MTFLREEQLSSTIFFWFTGSDGIPSTSYSSIMDVVIKCGKHNVSTTEKIRLDAVEKKKRGISLK